MNVKCLSVKNPNSYLICAGIKDVENRSWSTDYRGTLYIHSSGQDQAHCFLDGYDDALPVHHAFNLISEDNKGDPILNKQDLIGYDNKKNEYYLKSKNVNHVKEYEFIKLYYNDLNNDKFFFKSQAIIGKVDLVDVIQDSDSLFAGEGSYHWILKNPVLFKKPIMYVKGKLRFFNYDLRIKPEILKIA